MVGRTAGRWRDVGTRSGERMYALTVGQPFAWAIVAGHKTVENRSWATHYRGPLLIHAAKARHHDQATHLDDEMTIEVPAKLAYGALLGVVDLVDCLPLRRARR